jgi:hypothetical protein
VCLLGKRGAQGGPRRRKLLLAHLHDFPALDDHARAALVVRFSHDLTVGVAPLGRRPILEESVIQDLDLRERLWGKLSRALPIGLPSSMPV